MFGEYDDGDAPSQETFLSGCGGQHSEIVAGRAAVYVAAWADSRMTGMRISARHAIRQYWILG